MKRVVLCAALTAICVGAAVAADAPAKSPQDVAVATRVAAMKQMGGDLKAATDPAAKPADAKAKFAESIPTLFPKGTGIGDPGVTKTRALQDIWAKPAEFKAAADNLVMLLKAAEAAVDATDDTKKAG